ncbi:DExH-box ATP-dependent RNA helicase DExH6-like [Chenopodium quinoa]|uniref:DExH-box ATP-dependent RNA helicase DExH6-like n=1 Tax=Chenopodium quinoa TaxID=63459 RepID=UPI000B791DF4|nr:DExH-box ATP-dependent RNA helicase DExH6-like [Chenopodium quinoa]
MTKSSKKRQKYGSLFAPEHTAGVDEIVRIKIHNILEQFRSSHDQVYTFEPNMTNHERAVVHQESKKMGMISKSSGKGKQRRVAVFKSKPKLESSEQRENPVITFSDESKRVLNDLFIRYPPGEDEVGKEYSNGPTDNNNPRPRGKRENIFCKPLMNKDEIEKQAELLTSKIQQKHHLQEISKKRSKLPIATFQDVITSTILTHQVVLISGETGCGKTTQVPQYLLDSMWARGEACKIICTQPRRISAMSVADRISHERGENIGESVGYKIRMDTKGGRNSSIVFCTNGIMLRVLVSGGSNGSQPGSVDLSQISHIIVDEIHERDRYSDFMLAILRDLLPTYPHLRMVLMSATLDAERFSNYFGGCPVIRVPGFTHPVKTFYLEEILSILRTPDKNHLNSSLSSQVNEEGSLSEQSRMALDEAIEMSSSNEEFDTLLELISSEGTSKVLNYQHSLTGVSPLMVFAGKGRVGDICTLLSLGADCHLQAHDGSTALDWAKREDQSEAVEIIMKHMVDSSSSSVEEQQLLEKYMSTTNPDFIDVVLIEKLLRKICMESENGAILVFLPGWEDINRTRETLLANPFFKDSHKFAIFSLHSMVPSAEQKKVFNRPPVGCRKIILSTNIAETAITIDDVVYVLDSGRMKEKSYDPYSNVSTLQSSWTSKASAKQREGRAGRCQPGVCYHLYSKLRAVSFLDFQVPEIRRMPIEELCLQVKLLDPNCKVEDFLKKTLDPPVSETIKNAITVLQEIGALSHDEGLTELGRKLGSLPVHPLTSKMLFFAILLNCLDPALTLACAADYRDPFTLPMLPNEKKRAVAAKAELASLYGGNSDQLAIVAAFDCWRNARKMGQESRFCSEYFVSSSIMHMLSGMRNQLANELSRTGCIPDDISSCSMNAREPGIIRAVIVAGMYPMVGRLHPPIRRGKRLTVETANSGYDRVLLHPQSMNSKLFMKNTDELALLVYDEVTRVDGSLHTRNTTIISPIPLLLLATEIVVAPARDTGDDDSGSDAAGDEDSDEGEMECLEKKNEKPEDKVMSSPENSVTLIVDRWLPFVSTALEVAQIYCLRERLSAAILFKVTYPKKVLPPALGTSIYAIACVLAYDGMTGVSILKESVDTLTSMVHNTGIGNSSAEQNKANPAAKSFLISLFSYSAQYHESSSQPVQVQTKKHSSKRRRGNKSGQGGP